MVLVGETKQEFYIHEDLICASSDFFKAAMRNECQESLSRSVDLPEEDPEIFEVYRQWLYSGRICTIENDSEPCNVVRESRNLSHAYVLGEKLQDATFKDTILDSIIEHSDDGRKWSINMIKIIWEGTPPASLTRKYLIDRFIYYGNEELLSRFRHRLPEDFFYEIAVALLKCRARPGGKAPYKKHSICKYHEHAKDKPCYEDAKSS